MPDVVQEWTWWESRPGRIQLRDGGTCWVDPGDKVLIEYSRDTGQIHNFLDHKKRTLH